MFVEFLLKKKIKKEKIHAMHAFGRVYMSKYGYCTRHHRQDDDREKNEYQLSNYCVSYHVEWRVYRHM